jgi:two-component system chemotaxis response regulator CheY
LGSAVILKQVTDLVDLRSVIQTVSERWFGGQAQGPVSDATILLAEGSSFSRGLVRSRLEMAGYRVLEGADTAEVFGELQRRAVDLVIAALDLPGGGAYDLLARMRSVPNLSGIPVLALANSPEEARAPGKHADQFGDCQPKFDLDAMLRSVANLAASVKGNASVPVLAGEKE